MQTVIIVLVLLAGSAAALVCLALYRGWFRLASNTAEEKVEFVLMSKKDKVRADDKNAAASVGDSGRPAETPVSRLGFPPGNDKKA